MTVNMALGDTRTWVDSQYLLIPEIQNMSPCGIYGKQSYSMAGSSVTQCCTVS